MLGFWVRVLPCLTCELELLESPGRGSLFITLSVNQAVWKTNVSVALCGQAATFFGCFYSSVGCGFRAFCPVVAVPCVDRMPIRRTFFAVPVSSVSHLVPGNNAKLTKCVGKECRERHPLPHGFRPTMQPRPMPKSRQRNLC